MDHRPETCRAKINNICIKLVIDYYLYTKLFSFALLFVLEVSCMKQAFCCKFLRFSQWSNWEFQSSGMWCRITGNFLDVWNECDAFVLKGRFSVLFSTCGHHVLGDEGNSWL